MSYDDAVRALYQAPHGEFVNERKRLAAELKSSDKAGAAKLAKLPRPPISAWTVNQLWWHARAAFDHLFESAQKLRKGDLSATGEHREAIAKLRARAQQILADAGHGATESTLRRITTTLAALAASGGFDPDPEGALSADRDPPGFEAVGISAPEMVVRHAKPEPTKREAHADTKAEAEAAEKRAQAEAAAERRKKEQAEAKRLAELRGVETALSSARSEVERKQKELDRLRKAVEQAEGAVEKSQAVVDELEAKLAELVRETEEA